MAERASDLFETPPGVRILPPEESNPGATVVMLSGDIEESEQLLRGFDPEACIRHTRTDRPEGARVADIRAWRLTTRRPRRVPGRLRVGFGPGARFVYGLILITLSLGAVGLAASWQSREALVVAAFFSAANGVLFWVFWRSWLDGLPYVYRLLTSLGEEAENLADWRVWRALGAAARALYR